MRCLILTILLYFALPAYTQQSVAVIANSLATDNQCLWSVGKDGAIAASQDSGKTWSVKKLFVQQGDYDFTDIAFVKGNAPGRNIGWVIGNNNKGGKSIVLKTENEGRTWLIESICPLPAGTTFNDLEAIDSRRAYIHCNNGITLKYVMGQWKPTVKKAEEQTKRPTLKEASILDVGLSNASKAGFDTTQILDNIEIIWQRSARPLDPAKGDSIDSWGISLGGGDFNNDGYDDAALGYYYYGYTPIDSIRQVRVNIHYGKVVPDSMEDQTLLLFKGDGLDLCTGDFNGDGYDDLAVGNQGSHKGAVCVCYGGAAGLSDTPALTMEGTDLSGYGECIASGDVNGDGLDDLIVGASGTVVNNWLDGKVYIYYGDTLGLHDWPDVVLKGGIYDPQEQFGRKVASGNDLNGDGYDDVLVGAPENCETYFLAGKVYVYFGGSPMDTLPDGWVKGEGEAHALGACKLSITKLNNKSWACFGTPYYPRGYYYAASNGKVYLLSMSAAWDTIPQITKVGSDSITGLGYEVINLGRLGPDSLEDLGLSAYGYNPGDSLYYTTVEIWPGRSAMNTDSTGSILGPWWVYDYHRIGRAGDVDGDLKEEFMYSNPSFPYLYRVYLCRYIGPSGVEQIPDDRLQITGVKLGQNYPNPFRQATVISYQATGDGPVKLAVYNIAGQLVKTLINDNTVPLRIGEGRVGSVPKMSTVTWDGRDDNGRAVANGVYVYKLTSGGQSRTKKMIVIR